MTQIATDSLGFHMDPNLGEKIQEKNFQAMTLILVLTISTLVAGIVILNNLNLLTTLMIYIPAAAALAVWFFGNRLAERRMKGIYDDGTHSVVEEVNEFVSRVYGVALKEPVRLETVRVGERDKIRINPLSLSAVDLTTDQDVRVSVIFSSDYKTVILRKLTNDEWFEETSKSFSSAELVSE